MKLTQQEDEHVRGVLLFSIKRYSIFTYLSMLYDVDIEASACVLSSRYAMLCYAMLKPDAVRLLVPVRKNSVLSEFSFFQPVSNLYQVCLISSTHCYRIATSYCAEMAAVTAAVDYIANQCKFCFGLYRVSAYYCSLISFRFVNSCEYW